MITSLSTPRFRLALAGLFVGVVAITMFALLGVAHADPLPVDPVIAAQAATDASWALIAQYGPLWGAFLLAFGLVGAWLKANESKHWLAQGRALAVITGGAMVLGAVADWHFHGAAFAGVIVTAVMAIKLVMSPTVAPAPSSSSGSASSEAKAVAGAVSLLMIVLLVGSVGVTLTSCTAAQRTSVEHALWDCTSPQRAEFVAAATPLADSAIAKATNPDGSLDDAAIKQLFSGANLKTEAGTVLSCLAVETLTARAAAPALSARVAAAEAPLGVSPHAALEALRAAQFPGAAFKTPDGVR
jgi:hypothetical protein